jgi:Prenyltransferase and squalene oxidase repeat
LKSHALNDDEREQAILRGLKFLYDNACDAENFDAWGHDYLSCFYCIASTSRDGALRRMARSMGRERAREWRREHARVPDTADAETIASLVFGSDAANRLGMRDDALREGIRRAAGRFTAEDYFGFDAFTEPPPLDVPAYCDCGLYNSRGRKACRKCKKPLEMTNPYKLWTDALTRSYVGERYGVTVGAPYREVIKWLPRMRPYGGRAGGEDDNFYHTLYAVTHVVYTLNDYSTYNLSPELLPHEFEFLTANLEEAISLEDAEMMGEFLDSLMAFGLDKDNPLIRKGRQYLLSQQNPDGSWGDTDTEDIYSRYHPTWTAVDGLREYRWRGEGLSFPELKPILISVS